MTDPTSRHMQRYRQRAIDDPSDARLSSPVFHRNGPPLIAALAPWLAGRSGPVVEIGAGTGQHASAFRLAFPALDWRASDPDPLHRASIHAWSAAHGLPHAPALALDAENAWADQSEVAGLGPLAAVVAINVIHIAPFRVAEGIVAGAGKALAHGGLLIFYGPFKENGEHTGDGNRAFDAGLRAENLDWGVRDIADIGALARSAGLGFAALVAMPANNRTLIFRKS